MYDFKLCDEILSMSKNRLPYVKSEKMLYFTVRAGLKPVQPMQLHWAPRLWRPRTMVFG